MTSDGGYEADPQPVEIAPEIERGIRRACFLAMRDALGSGYVPDYYKNEAGAFIAIALRAYREGVRVGRAER